MGRARALLQPCVAPLGENRLPWVLDRAFRGGRKPYPYTGHAAHHMSILRRLALNLLRRETTAQGGIAAQRKPAGWNHEYLLKILSH